MKSKELEQANEIVANPKKAEEFLHTLSSKQPMVEKVIEKLEEFPILIEMVKSYLKKEYTHIPITTIVGIIATLIYIISPIDLVPDPIPGIGKVDDLTLAWVCLVLVDKDIQKYKDWKKQNSR